MRRIDEVEARTAEAGAEHAGREAVIRRHSEDGRPETGDREIVTPAANELAPSNPPTAARNPSQLAAGFSVYAEQSSLGLAIIGGGTHVIKHANPAFRRMRSRDGELATFEVVGRSLDAVLPPCVAVRIASLLLDAERNGAVRSEIEVEWADERDTAHWWQVAILPALSEDPSDFVMQIADVTVEVEDRRRVSLMVEELRQVNERLLLASIREQDLREQADAANDAKSTFLAMMSHELRTPLTAIIGYEELLADGITGPVTDPQRTQLMRIKASAAHLLTLIDEVLSLSRIEAGRETVRSERFDVGALMDAAAELVAPLVASKGVTCAVRRPDHRITLNSEPLKVRQILVNLLANAVKFTERGEVTITARQHGDTVTFEVRDTGIGIDARHLERIFDAFWQVQQKSTRRVGGTGLGLHVSRRLARLLGGDITVESTPGRGSTFVLALPLDFPIGASGGA